MNQYHPGGRTFSNPHDYVSPVFKPSPPGAVDHSWEIIAALDRLTQAIEHALELLKTQNSQRETK